MNHQTHDRDARNERVVFTTAQLEMLQMSEEDLKHGCLISQEQLDEEDLKWLESTEQNGSCCPIDTD